MVRTREAMNLKALSEQLNAVADREAAIWHSLKDTY
jgi:hypothetical protein